MFKQLQVFFKIPIRWIWVDRKVTSVLQPQPKGRGVGGDSACACMPITQNTTHKHSCTHHKTHAVYKHDNTSCTIILLLSVRLWCNSSGYIRNISTLSKKLVTILSTLFFLIFHFFLLRSFEDDLRDLNCWPNLFSATLLY